MVIMSAEPSASISPNLALIKPLVKDKFRTGSYEVPFAMCTHALFETVENATISSSPSPFISPTDTDVALSQVWIGAEVVIPEFGAQSAQTTEVELFD